MLSPLEVWRRSKGLTHREIAEHGAKEFEDDASLIEYCEAVLLDVEKGMKDIGELPVIVDCWIPDGVREAQIDWYQQGQA